LISGNESGRSLPALQSLSLLQQSSNQSSHRVAQPDSQPRRGRFNRAICSDASRGVFGNLNDVLTTLRPGEFKAFPGHPAKLARGVTMYAFFAGSAAKKWLLSEQ
jgi:hypothetical protein